MHKNKCAADQAHARSTRAQKKGRSRSEVLEKQRDLNGEVLRVSSRNRGQIERREAEEEGEVRERGAEVPPAAPMRRKTSPGDRRRSKRALQGETGEMAKLLR